MAYTTQLQNSDGSHCRWIGASEWQDMERRGEVHVYTKGKRVIARLKPQIAASTSRPTANSITYADVLANVGLQDRPHSTTELSRGRQRAAQEKIAAFGSQHMRCTWRSAPACGFDVSTTLILNVADEVLAFDDSSASPSAQPSAH